MDCFDEGNYVLKRISVKSGAHNKKVPVNLPELSGNWEGLLILYKFHDLILVERHLISIHLVF